MKRYQENDAVDRENSDEMTITTNNNYIIDEVDVLQLCSAGNNSGDILTSYTRKIPQHCAKRQKIPCGTIATVYLNQNQFFDEYSLI